MCSMACDDGFWGEGDGGRCWTVVFGRFFATGKDTLSAFLMTTSTERRQEKHTQDMRGRVVI